MYQAVPRVARLARAATRLDGGAPDRTAGVCRVEPAEKAALIEMLVTC
ncbi:hypothetical protein ACQEVF_45540 [Nonomuraea polychroma]